MIWNLLPFDRDINRLYYNTYYLALRSLAEKYHIGYEEPGMVTLDNIMNFTFQLPDCEDPIIFVAYHPNFGIEFKEHILKKCPRAKIVLTGSDTVYYGVEDSVRMKPDLFIDTIKEQVKLANRAVPSTHIYWTLSQDVIDEISLLPDRNKDIAGICLCANSHNRSSFFHQTMDKLGGNILWGLNTNRSDMVYDFFKRAYITIGITMSAPGFGDGKARSMKGMRDWLGVAAGTLLIYDDYPDIVDLGIIPIYPYRDSIKCAELMYNYIWEVEVREEIITKQQNWLKQNTMEKQLEKILLKYNLL